MSVASELECALDPVVFAQEKLKFDPYEWQKEEMRAGEQESILCCFRQAGKSTVVSVKELHGALYQPRTLALVGAPTEPQSIEFLLKVKEFYRIIPGAPRLLEDNKTSCVFQNGSRIVALPGSEKRARGYSNPRSITLDEASRIPDEVNKALRPMLSRGGRVRYISTPFGKRGFFWDYWNDPSRKARKRLLRVTDVDYISKGFLENELEAEAGKHGIDADRWYRQEYLCEFLEAEDALFTFDFADTLGTLEAPEPLFSIEDDSYEVKPLFPEDRAAPADHRVAAASALDDTLTRVR